MNSLTPHRSSLVYYNPLQSSLVIMLIYRASLFLIDSKMSVQYSVPLPENVSNKTAGYTILLVLSKRKLPTRSQTIVDDLRGTCSKNEVFKTINELQDAGLIILVTDKHRFKDYVVTDQGRKYIKEYPSLQVIANELAEYTIRVNQIITESEIDEVYAEANEATP